MCLKALKGSHFVLCLDHVKSAVFSHSAKFKWLASFRPLFPDVGGRSSFEIDLDNLHATPPHLAWHFFLCRIMYQFSNTSLGSFCPYSCTLDRSGIVIP